MLLEQRERDIACGGFYSLIPDIETLNTMNNFQIELLLKKVLKLHQLILIPFIMVHHLMYQLIIQIQNNKSILEIVYI